MFWERFYQLCIEHNTKPNPVAVKLGISSGSVSYWKSGAIPKLEAVTKIADYFCVSVDYLLGKTDQKEKSVATNDNGPKESAGPNQGTGIEELLNLFDAMADEQKNEELLKLYDSMTDAQKAVFIVRFRVPYDAPKQASPELPYCMRRFGTLLYISIQFGVSALAKL